MTAAKELLLMITREGECHRARATFSASFDGGRWVEPDNRPLLGVAAMTIVGCSKPNLLCRTKASLGRGWSGVRVVHDRTQRRVVNS